MWRARVSEKKPPSSANQSGRSVYHMAWYFNLELFFDLLTCISSIYPNDSIGSRCQTMMRKNYRDSDCNISSLSDETRCLLQMLALSFRQSNISLYGWASHPLAADCKARSSHTTELWAFCNLQPRVTSNEYVGKLQKAKILLVRLPSRSVLIQIIRTYRTPIVWRVHRTSNE